MTQWDDNQDSVLRDLIHSVTEGQGARVGGIADLSQIPEPEAILPAVENWSDYSRAISLYIPVSNKIIDALPRRTVADSFNYAIHYDIAHNILDHAAFQVARALEEQGFGALPVPTNRSLPPERRHGFFSHKLAAHLAGLGWVGRHTLLIAHPWGPRVRLSTVLTNAPLQGAYQVQEPQCRDCQVCVRTCPAGAISGRSFSVLESRDQRIDVAACRQYMNARRDEWELPHASSGCGLCLQSCPKYSRPKQ